MGGEPFLYRGLNEVLEMLIGMDKIEMVEITTNGTLMPQDTLLPLLKTEKVFVQISDYGKYNAEKKRSLIQLFEKHGINYTELSALKWIDSGNMERRGQKRYKLKYKFFNCFASIECRTLWDGRLFVCGRAPALYELGKSKDISNYLEINELEDLSILEGKERLRKFYMQDYAECCDFCDYANIHPKYIPNGIQIKKG